VHSVLSEKDKRIKGHPLFISFSLWSFSLLREQKAKHFFSVFVALWLKICAANNGFAFGKVLPATNPPAPKKSGRAGRQGH
jgi:hypothetical protein